MSFEANLRTRLKGDSGVQAAVGSSGGVYSIDWNERPQGAPYPAIVLDTIFDTRSQHMAGFNTYQPTRTQLRCTALTRAAAIALRDAAIAAITPTATVSGMNFLRTQDITTFQRTEGTDEATLHHEIIDATIWHN